MTPSTSGKAARTASSASVTSSSVRPASRPFQLPRGAVGEDPAGVDDHHPFRGQVRLLQVVGREQDRLAQGRKVGHLPPEHPPGPDVEGGGRLVEVEQVGVADDGQGEGQPLPLPARQLGDPPLAVALQGRPLEHLPGGQTVGVVGRHQVDDLGDGQALGSVGVLQHRPDPAPDRGRIGAEDTDGAGAGAAEAQEHLKGRRLARTVRAEDGDDLTLPHPQVDSVDGQNVAEATGEAPGLDHVSSHNPCHLPLQDTPTDGRPVGTRAYATAPHARVQ